MYIIFLIFKLNSTTFCINHNYNPLWGIQHSVHKGSFVCWRNCWFRGTV